MLRYSTFKELFADHDPALFGEENREFLLNQIKQFYTDEDEQKYGVLGIRLKVGFRQGVYQVMLKTANKILFLAQ